MVCMNTSKSIAFAHTDEDVAEIGQAFDEACKVCREGISSGVEKLLIGPAARPVFRRYNGCKML